MAESKLRDLSMNFAVDVLKLCGGIKGHFSITNQLERSATSIGANIHEANYAQSKADFVAKCSIALKECDETGYWLELLKRTEYISSAQYDSIESDRKELFALLTSIIKTSKETLKKWKMEN